MTASTGDHGTAVPEYPAFSPNVVAVGGTTLSVNSDNSYGSETGWVRKDADLTTDLDSIYSKRGYETDEQRLSDLFAMYEAMTVALESANANDATIRFDQFDDPQPEQAVGDQCE